jgi:hypothetical protein
MYDMARSSTMAAGPTRIGGSLTMPMHLKGDEANQEVEMEGYLRKIRKLL